MAMRSNKTRRQRVWAAAAGSAAVSMGLALALLPGSLRAQATAYPLPLVTTVAGLATGSGNTLCTNGLANVSGQQLGDGCLPTQAQLLTLYDNQVDAAGNVYIAENGTNNDIRVIYNGGAAMASLLTIANGFQTNFTPIPGRIYTLAGGISSTLAHTNNAYYCGNIVGGQQALDSQGNGCPAAEVYLKPRGMAMDALGNIFTTTSGGGNLIRVIYVAGSAVANLITLENPGVTPKPGYIYKLAGQSTANYSGDGGLASAAAFVYVRYLAVDSNDNLFISDATTTSVVGGKTIEAAAANVREINAATGKISTIAGETTCNYASTTGCPYGYSGDGGPATSALLSSPYALFVDAANNLYIADYYNSRIRVVYLTAGSTIAGISNPVVGNIYTYAGGGSSTAAGSLAAQVKFNSLYVAGIDRQGNIYAEDATSKAIWRFDATTSAGYIVAGGATSTSVAQKGAACVTGSPVLSTDSLGDGCPGPQSLLSDTGTVSFDNAGDGYVAENGNGIVRELSPGNQFPASSAAVSQPLLFEVATTALPIQSSAALGGGATTEFSVGSAVCSTTNAATGYQICVLPTAFTPSHPGLRNGSVTVLSSASALLTELVTGVGLAADLAVDPGTQLASGSALQPAGVAFDQRGSFYVADTATNAVYKGALPGMSLSKLAGGLLQPTALAVNGLGDLYVANTGANSIVELDPNGNPLATLGSGLSKPQGVAVDGLGNLYVSDTGNNRIVEIYPNGSQSVVPVQGLSAPHQLTLDASGNLYILDTGNNRIVEYFGNAQSVLTLDAGVQPAGLALDAAGDLYVADASGLKLQVYPVGVAAGETLATGLVSPVALAADVDGNLLLADAGRTSALSLNRSLGAISFPLTNVGQTTQASITVSNVGNSSLSFSGAPLTSQTGSSLFSVASATSNGCGLGIAYTAGQECNFTASFAPQATGPAKAAVQFNTNAADGATASAALNAQGLLLTKTSMALTVISPAAAPYYYSQGFTLSAVVTPSTVTTTPTGTYTFTVDGKGQAPVSIGSGTVTLSLSLLAGQHTVIVTYSGDGTYASSAASLTFTQNPAVTATALTITPVNSNGALSLSFSAAVTSSTAKVTTGAVTFYAGTTALGTVNVNSSGSATYSTTALTFATNSFSAVYADTTDSNYAGSTSATVTPVADFALGIPSASLAISQGGVATVAFTVAPLFNGQGSITLSCTGLPANSVCRFQPITMTLGSTPQQESVLIYTNVASNLAQNESPQNTPFSGSGIYAALGLGWGLGLLTLRRRRAVRRATLLACVALTLTLGGLSGCNAGTTASVPTTPPGTSSISVIFTGSNGLTTSHTATVSLTVIQDSGTF